MKPTACPSCRQPMSKHRFERLHHGEIVLDLCFPCQGLWFDEFESAQITPGGILALFRLLHEHRDAPHQPLGEPLHCPRCNERLLHALDRARHGGQFNYYRCLQRHGRFTTFAQFMIEKGFVRHLNSAEVKALAARIGTVRCNSCGAPVDIRHESACSHCRAPIAILDPTALEQATQRLEAAEIRRTTRDVEALGDAIVMRAREKSRYRRQAKTRVEDIDVVDLVADGIAFFAKLLD